MRHQGKPAPLAGSLLAASLATLGLLTLNEAAYAAEAPNTVLPSVQVKGDGQVNDRKDATAAKIVVSAQDLARYSDSTLADALQRIPGVSVVRVPGKDAQIQLRGMGAGYTQILINGEAAPAGFSIESLSPDLVDRVEILRSATADMSTQGIAGTINIILRKPRNAPWLFKASMGDTDGRPSQTMSLDLSGHHEAWTWGTGGAVSAVRGTWQTWMDTQGSASDTDYHYRTFSSEGEKTYTVALTPQLGWKSGDDNSVSLTGLLQNLHRTYQGTDTRTSISGTEPQFGSNELRAGDTSRLARASLEWNAAFSETSKLETKLTATVNTRRIHGYSDSWDNDDVLVLSRDVHSTMHDETATLSGKYSLGLGEAHTLGVGWDAQTGRRRERRIQDDSSTVGYALLDLDEDYTADITRTAVFAQDEWTINEQLSTYFGVRWEGLRTETRGTDLDAQRVRASVVSPTAQAIWKVPDTKADQVRLALGRSYKAPTARDLVPRRWIVSQNGPTTPDFIGNPSLKPELSWGLDLSYERYLKDDGLISLNAYVRRIHDVVVQRIYEDAGTWYQSPFNEGNALVRGLEFEMKGPLKSVLTDAPDVTLRLGATRNWSHLDSVPGPGNRLGRQAPFTATVGADWRINGPWTVGANFSFEQGGYVRASETQALIAGNKRLLDLFAAWQVSNTTKLRFTVTDALAAKGHNTVEYFDSSAEETAASTTRNRTSFRVQVETRF